MRIPGTIIWARCGSGRCAQPPNSQLLARFQCLCCPHCGLKSRCTAASWGAPMAAPPNTSRRPPRRSGMRVEAMAADAMSTGTPTISRRWACRGSGCSHHSRTPRLPHCPPHSELRASAVSTTAGSRPHFLIGQPARTLTCALRPAAYPRTNGLWARTTPLPEKAPVLVASAPMPSG